MEWMQNPVSNMAYEEAKTDEMDDREMKWVWD